jgi:hypothetical protein
MGRYLQLEAEFPYTNNINEALLEDVNKIWNGLPNHESDASDVMRKLTKGIKTVLEKMNPN